MGWIRLLGHAFYYAGIWDRKPSPPWVARHDLNAQEYQAVFDKLVPKGYRVPVVSVYTLGENEDRYAAIWVKE